MQQSGHDLASWKCFLYIYCTRGRKSWLCRTYQTHRVEEVVFPEANRFEGGHHRQHDGKTYNIDRILHCPRAYACCILWRNMVPARTWGQKPVHNLWTSTCVMRGVTCVPSKHSPRVSDPRTLGLTVGEEIQLPFYQFWCARRRSPHPWLVRGSPHQIPNFGAGSRSSSLPLQIFLKLPLVREGQPKLVRGARTSSVSSDRR